jgi:hypothetical protein
MARGRPRETGCRRVLGILAAALLLEGAAASTGGTDLAAEAKALAEAAQKKYGRGYVTRVDAARHIVYVSALDQYTLGRVTGLLGTFADSQRQLLFPHTLPWNVTVVLPTVADYRKPMPRINASGHYEAATRVLESISLSDVLLHEFTHALHHADQVRANQRHAVWICEGLATLFQRSTMREGRLEVLLGRDLAGLQQAVKNQKAPSFAALLAMDQPAFLSDAEACYAEAHYLIFYLNSRGKLKDFYENYKAGYAADRTGATALAKTLGKPLDQVEADWRQWLLAQEPPWTPARPSKALLGVKMEPAEQGVTVAGIIRGSAAESAGQLKVGDIVVSVAGQSTRTPHDLTAAVQTCRPGQTIDIEVIRDDRTMLVRQLLSVMPP